MRASNDWLRPLLQRWEALNNAWQQQVLGYDQRRQQALLQRLGLPGGWQTLAWLLAGLSTLGLVLLTTLLLYQKREAPRRKYDSGSTRCGEPESTARRPEARWHSPPAWPGKPGNSPAAGPSHRILCPRSLRA